VKAEKAKPLPYLDLTLLSSRRLDAHTRQRKTCPPFTLLPTAYSPIFLISLLYIYIDLSPCLEGHLTPGPCSSSSGDKTEKNFETYSIYI